MGLEYIVQPQVFLGGLTALGPGIQGLTEQYPLLTTYYSWVSTNSNDDASVWPIPIELGSIYEGPGKEASFIVSVGGVIQSPTEYTIDTILRTITFNTVVSADIEVAVTQLATAAPSSQSFDFIQSVDSVITNLTADNLLSTSVLVTGITADNLFVLDGEATLQELNVTGDTTLEDLYVTNAYVTNLSADSGAAILQELNVTDEIVFNSVIDNLTATDVQVDNLSADTAVITDLTATNITANMATINGDISASGKVLASNNYLFANYNILTADRAAVTTTGTLFFFGDTEIQYPEPGLYETSTTLWYTKNTSPANVVVILSASNLITIQSGLITHINGVGALTNNYARDLLNYGTSDIFTFPVIVGVLTGQYAIGINFKNFVNATTTMVISASAGAGGMTAKTGSSWRTRRVE